MEQVQEGEKYMNAQILDGKKTALKVREEIKDEVALFEQQNGKKVKLCVVIVGDNSASKVYVRNKRIACEKAGIESQIVELAVETSQSELISLIEKLNNDNSVNGILVQLPLPGHIDEDAIIEVINPEKDVDAFHPFNTGMLLSGNPAFEPCTPGGIIELLKYEGIETSGKHVVIIGRSNIVGKPLAALLLLKGSFGDATVTVCHSRTKNLKDITLMADILVAAIGRANFVSQDMIKDGAVVIDVGINRVDDPTLEKGYKLVGDVNYEEALTKASFITPVPGGVGPMTIAILLRNALTAAKRQLK